MTDSTRWRWIAIATAFALTATLAACGGGGGGSAATSTTGTPATPVDSTPQNLTCVDAATVDTALGRLVNNTWNRQAAAGASYTQCLRMRNTADGVQYGWSWQWPQTATSVYAYPELLVGWNPWLGGTTNRTGLPIRIGAVQAFTLSYALDTQSTGRVNLASDIWITRSGATPVAGNETDISTELMVWTVSAGLQPGGTKLAVVTIDGQDFEVWYAADWGDASGSSGQRWRYIAYRATAELSTASVNLQKILADASARGLVDPTHYVASLELGNEVIGGSGSTWVRQFALDVR